MKVPGRKAPTSALLAASIVLALAGVAAFLWIFARDFNIYWLILSPVIITVYELPAVYMLHLYRKRRAAAQRSENQPAGGPDGGPDQA